MRKSPWKVAAIAAALALSAGCSKKAPKELPPAPGDGTEAGTATGVDDGSESDPTGGVGPGSREDFIRTVGLEGDRRVESVTLTDERRHWAEPCDLLCCSYGLVPNTELGHLEIDGHDYETRAAYSVKERENLSWAKWAGRLQKYYSTLEKLFTPDLFIVGGGVSKHAAEYLPLLNLRTPIVAAELRNNAGIMGAAALASGE